VSGGMIQPRFSTPASELANPQLIQLSGRGGDTQGTESIDLHQIVDFGVRYNTNRYGWIWDFRT
jgi:hypothetical protein